jgi:hypothetical protein
MLYRARMQREADGAWVASAVELPLCWSRAATREEALQKLRSEIRYRIELCPCSSVDEEFVEVELVPEEVPPRVRPRGERTGAPAPTSPDRTGPRPEGWRRWDD